MMNIANGSMCHTVFAMMRIALGTWSVNQSTWVLPRRAMMRLTTAEVVVEEPRVRDRSEQGRQHVEISIIPNTSGRTRPSG